MVQVPAARDITQATKKENYIEKYPHIRVWCHPHKIGLEGDDYFIICDNFEEAFRFIDAHKEAERTPLIAFRGWELNLFDMERAPLFK